MAKLTENIGDYTVTMEVLPPGIAKLHWRNGNGKKINNLPKSVCEKCPTEYRNIREKFKSIQHTLRVQTKRIESFYFEDFKASIDEWWRHYAEHPLMNSISSNLIWKFESDVNVDTAILKNKKLIMADGLPLDNLPDNTAVSLWHPLLSDAGTRDAWRNYIWKNSILQPFRQAFREVYVDRPEENNQSIIDGLYVRQHQFRALLLTRGWRYQFRGRFDSDSVPTLNLERGVSCEIDIIGQSEVSSSAGISLAIELGKVRFLRGGAVISRSEISPIEYSEVMRDIDLFVAVCGLGYRKDWDQIEEVFYDLRNSILVERLARIDGRASTILNDLLIKRGSSAEAITKILCVLDVSMMKFPIAETVKTRALLLDLMLKGSKITDQVRIDDRYVYVDTNDGGCRINLASGLVFSVRDNQLLPVAAKRISKTSEAESDILLSRLYGLVLQLAAGQNSMQ